MTGQTNPTFAGAQQSLSPGNRVELFELDLRPLLLEPEQLPPGGRLYFSPSSLGDAEIMWRGQKYTSAPIQASGFEVSGQGQLPRPYLRIANVNNLAGTLARSYDDLTGAVLTRTITMAQYLDGQPLADPDAAAQPTVWEVIQKNKQNKLYIEWILASFLDQEGEEIPKRKVWKNTCLWKYRTFSRATGAFDYTHADGCSYAGSLYFDADGNPVQDPAADACGLRPKDCKLRFGATAELPFGGFLGVNNR